MVPSLRNELLSDWASRMNRMLSGCKLCSMISLILIKLHCNIDTITATYWTAKAAWQCYPHFLQELITFKGPFLLFRSYIFQAWSSVVHSNNWLSHHETSVSELHLLCISPLQWLQCDSTWLTNIEKQHSVFFNNKPQVKTTQTDFFLFIITLLDKSQNSYRGRTGPTYRRLPSQAM